MTLGIVIIIGFVVHAIGGTIVAGGLGAAGMLLLMLDFVQRLRGKQ